MSVFLAAVLVAGIVGGIYMFNTVGTADRDATFVGDSVFCANNPALSGEIRIRDALASSTEYLNGTVLVRNERNGQIREVEVEVTGSEYVSIGNLECGGAGYTIFVDGSGDNLNSHDPVVITADELDAGVIDISKTIMASRFAMPTVDGVFDRRGNEFTTIGDDALFAELELRIDANTAFGKSAYVTLTVDDDAEVWDVDTLQVSVNGQRLSQATLSADEERALRNREVVFALPKGIGSDGARVTVFEVRAQPHSDYEYDAGNTEDVVMEIWARGDVEEDEEILRNVAFSGNSLSDALNTEFPYTFTH